MSKIYYQLVVMLIFVGFIGCKQQAKTSNQVISIIPQPTEMILGKGFFELNQQTQITYNKDLVGKAEQLSKLVKSETGLEIPVSTSAIKSNTISLSIDNSLDSMGNEGYKLQIQKKKISIIAPTKNGIFYGIQTLQQLLSANIENTNASQSQYWKVPCLSITDSPRFKWRGLMLDCSRTFWNKEYIKRTIRLMSFYKMNVLHLHLTDDQGWRIEIEKYPELTQKGAHFPEKWNEPKEREGFYSKSDINEIIEYAAKHNITIVPEIEMPGHSLAALSCYPELSCTGETFEIHPFFKGPSIHEDIFCAGNEKTFEFLENVLTEVCEMFPSEIIHIGGDEAPKARWEVCEKCQARIKEEGLKDEHELQSWFIKRIEGIISAKGKKLIGWDEIMEGGLSRDASVMFWRGKKPQVLEEAVQNGNTIVLSPTTHCYFDYKYERISTMKAYDFEPVPEGISDEQAKNILGLQANFWSHIDRTEAGVDKQLFPRILSIAEVAWSPENHKDSTNFKQRVNNQLAVLEKLGVNYYPDPSVVTK